jgi:maleylpyruvate isomerase
VGAPIADIAAVRTGTRRVLFAVDDLTDEQAAAPSRLPGWSRAEVLTHLARNADGGRGIAEAAARGEVGAQYPGGRDQRRVGIAAGRGLGAPALRADLQRSSDALLEAWGRLPDDAWERVGRSLNGDRTQREWVWSRWREIEVHHVDLGLGYAPSEWPVAFVTRGLDDAITHLPGRAARDAIPVDATFRLEASDHDRTWIVRTFENGDARVESDASDAPVDGIVSGWGCDLLAWLYGRDHDGGRLAATGDAAALRLPEWFPFA